MYPTLSIRPRRCVRLSTPEQAVGASPHSRGKYSYCALSQRGICYFASQSRCPQNTGPTECALVWPHLYWSPILCRGSKQ